MDEHTGPTAAEAARYARSTRAWMAAQTIADRYRADREGCRNRGERATVWRTYAKAMLQEMADRINANAEFWVERRANFDFIRWRDARGDDELPIRYRPAWRAMSDQELLDLEEALIRARYRGADQPVTINRPPAS